MQPLLCRVAKIVRPGMFLPILAHIMIHRAMMCIKVSQYVVPVVLGFVRLEVVRYGGYGAATRQSLIARIIGAE